MADDRKSSTFRARARERLARWQEPAWPLAPLSAMGRRYRLTVVGSIAANLVVALALLGAVAVFGASTRLEWDVVVGTAVLTLVLTRDIFRLDRRHHQDPTLSVALMLAAAGRWREALVCTVVGRLAMVIRKPLVTHLFVANILQAAVAVGAVAVAAVAVGGGPIPLTLTGLGVGALFLTLANFFTATNIALVLSSGGYQARADALRDARKNATLDAFSGVPLVLVLGAAIGAGPLPLLALLIVPRLIAHVALVRQEEATEAREEADTDPVTGLRNRRALERAVTGNDGSIVLCMLDGFVSVNNRYGHDAGDHVLRNAASALTPLAGVNDTCARTMGPEFVWWLPGVNAADGLESAHALVDVLQQHPGLLGTVPHVGVHRVGADEPFEAALQHAEVAAYLSRSRGYAAVTLSDPEQGVTGRDMDVSDDSDAIEVDSSPLDLATLGPDVQARLLVADSKAASGAAATALLEQAAACGTGGWALHAQLLLQLDEHPADAGLMNQARTVLAQARADADAHLEVASLIAIARIHRVIGDLDAASGLLVQSIRVGAAHDAHDAVCEAHAHHIAALIESLQQEEAVAERQELERYAAMVGPSLRVDPVRMVAAVPIPAEELVLKLRAVADPESEKASDLVATAQQLAPTPLASLVVREAEARFNSDPAVRASGLEATGRLWRRAGRVEDAMACEVAAAIARIEARQELAAVAALAAVRREARGRGMDEIAELCAGHIAAIDGGDLEMHSPLLEGLPEDELQLVLDCRSVVERVRNHEFFREDDMPDALYILESGSVRLFRVAEAGKALTVAVLDPGDIFGEACVLGLDRAGVRAEALDDVRLTRLDAEQLRPVLDASPRLQRNLSQLLGTRLQRVHDLAEQMAYRSVSERFAGVVLDLAARYGHPTLQGGVIVNRHFTQDQLAEMVGSSRKALAAELAELRSSGVLELRKRRLVILDRAALAVLAGRPDDTSNAA